MVQHIGILACSAEGASLCYRTICSKAAALMGKHAHPEISLHGFSLADYARCLAADDIPCLVDLMLSSAEKLAQGGADFLICPDNTIHRAFDLVEPRSPLPWLHIADAVAATAFARGLRRLGLLGTAWLVESDVYPQRLAQQGLTIKRPATGDQALMQRIIMDELVMGRFEPQSVQAFQGIVMRLKQAGCDGVILGCTEIPLILEEENSTLPCLDSTRLLARAALDRALSTDKAS